MQYGVTLPRDPSAKNPTAPGKSYQFELNGTFWFGMALCDTQSYPEQLSTCKPDSDKNIVDPAKSPKHAGTAFMELQFYPPGWIPWPTWAVAVGASACDPDQVVRRAEHRQPVGEPGHRPAAELDLRRQGGHRVLELRLRHEERPLAGAGQPGERRRSRRSRRTRRRTCS